jgi:hypothetical protein
VKVGIVQKGRRHRIRLSRRAGVPWRGSFRKMPCSGRRCLGKNAGGRVTASGSTHRATLEAQ